ncbi:MAG: hypothetical protein ACI86H_001353 [bacterium]|jgi:uncharacterized protein (TIGR00266 family)
MNSEIIGKPSFAYINVDLVPGESITAESDAMASMDTELDMKVQFNGGFFRGLLRKFFGGESLFVVTYTNNSTETKRVTLVQPTPGDVQEIDLKETSLCMQPGAYLCSTPGVILGLRWAGFVSWFAREGLFKLVVSGTGKVWYGAYGALLTKEVNGEYIVDTSHLVAYEPQLKMKIQLIGGIFTSLFSGEGFVTRIIGTGKIVLQTRSLEGLRDWLNPRI